MTNEMQWGVALAMLREIAIEEKIDGAPLHDRGRLTIQARVRSAYNILRNLDVHNGGCKYEPDRDLCRSSTQPKGVTWSSRE